MKYIKGGDLQMIRLIVNKFPVWATNKEVLREFFRRATIRKAKRVIRREIYQYALKTHKQNGELYVDVMKGGGR